MHRLLTYVADNLLADRERWVLWLPVVLAMGIGVYFLLPLEPPVWTGLLLLVLSLLANRFLARSGAGSGVPGFLSVALLVFMLGFTSAQVRTLTVEAPVLAKTLSSARFAGRVVQVEHFPDGGRITLEHPQISKVDPFELPERVRIRIRGTQPKLEPGDWVSGRGQIAPPAAPVIPGGFDFQRHAYFQQIGGFGFAYGPVTVTAKAASRESDMLALWVSRARDQITTRILKGLQAPEGGIAAALMTGEKHAVAASIVENLRNSGLAHLLSISGLHIGLIAGIVFSAVRILLVLVPGLALRHPIKKWASVAAIAAAFAYALLAGATLPTQRAFLMAAIALLAILLDRRGLSLRSVAWAAFVVLLIQPESLLGPSFQMSFAATLALVAGYEGWVNFRHNRLRLGTSPPKTGLHRTVGRYIAGVCLTTVIASAATAPYALYHFNQFAEFSLFANFFAVPLTALWVMPWAVISFIALPLGLESWTLQPMGWGIQGIISIADLVSNWPGAVTRLPAIPVWGIVLTSFAGLWLFIWRRRWRFFAIPCLCLGIASFAFVPTPDVIIDGQARFFAVKTDQETYAFSRTRAGAGDRDLWLRHLGVRQTTFIQYGSPDGAQLPVRLRCDSSGCLYSKADQNIAIAETESALQEDCWSAHVLISMVPVRRYCPATPVIDRFSLWRGGTHAVWVTPSGVTIRSANSGRGDRPWVLKQKNSRTDAANSS